MTTQENDKTAGDLDKVLNENAEKELEDPNKTEDEKSQAKTPFSCQCVDDSGCICCTKPCCCIHMKELIASLTLKPLDPVKCLQLDPQYPYDANIKTETLEQDSDGVKFSAKITNSGLFEVESESPHNAMETHVNRTESGNIEIVTIVHRYSEISNKMDKGYIRAAPPNYGKYPGKRLCGRTANKTNIGIIQKLGHPSDCDCKDCKNFNVQKAETTLEIKSESEVGHEGDEMKEQSSQEEAQALNNGKNATETSKQVEDESNEKKDKKGDDQMKEENTEEANRKATENIKEEVNIIKENQEDKIKKEEKEAENKEGINENGTNTVDNTE